MTAPRRHTSRLLWWHRFHLVVDSHRPYDRRGLGRPDPTAAGPYCRRTPLSRETKEEDCHPDLPDLS